MKRGKLKFKDGRQPHFQTQKTGQQCEIQQIFQQKYKLKDTITTYKPIIGSGMILSSGRGVNGQQTKFRTQVEKDDTIIIQHPITNIRQQKNIMLVLSDKSLILSQPFTQDIINYIPYTIQKKCRIQVGQDLTEGYKKRLLQLQEVHKKKLINKEVMNVRVKKGPWSYQIKKIEVEEGTSKEQLLNIREKMGKDKFCW